MSEIVRQNYEQYLLENMEQFDIVRINRKELSVLTVKDLYILHEVCKDRKTYNLAKSHLDFNPDLWNDDSLKAWIDFVSEKYVDNNKVDMSKGESPALEETLRNYWHSQRHMWSEAAKIYEFLKELSDHRQVYEKILRLAENMDLSNPYPPLWTSEDKRKFAEWYNADMAESSLAPHEFLSNKIAQWTETFHVIHENFHVDLHHPQSLEDDEEEVMVAQTEDMSPSPSSFCVADCTPSPSPSSHVTFQEVQFISPIQSIAFMPDYGDPEDWDREQLNNWLRFECIRYGYGFDPRNLLEKQRRLIMIYVRCAWPCDTDQYSLAGICRVFGTDFGRLLHTDILKMRPTDRVQESVPKPDSQRHRNRRDLHLWEFLLILLANFEYESDSIHWKDQSRGIFELGGRHRVARLWGLTKGNDKMNYDNMSRSVRQYYKGDKAGIMIRHQPRTQSLGKYSYQFSMTNHDVQKLWKSLHGS